MVNTRTQNSEMSDYLLVSFHVKTEHNFCIMTVHAVLKTNWMIKILKAPICKCLCIFYILHNFHLYLGGL